MKNTFLFTFLTLLFMGIFYACTKSTSDANGTSEVKVRMTDNPYNADEINIDLREIRVNTRNSDEWVVLSTNAGIYNLLSFQNGIDTLVASGQIQGNYINEVRFVLGSNNSIKIAGITLPLTIPSGSESGLKLKVDQNINNNSGTLLVDFDAALSVHQTGNGSYMLQPVLKLK